MSNSDLFKKILMTLKLIKILKSFLSHLKGKYSQYLAD